MKNLHPARKRLLIGFLLLAATFFYAFAGTCGLIGQLISRASATLLGQTGSTLVALVMLGVGLMLVIPHGAVRGFFSWVWHGREARVGRVVDEMHVAERRRTVQRHFMEKLEEDAAEPKVAPAQRMKLDAVRGALKELGYKKYEFEPVVSGLDPTLSEELLVRDAVKQLHAGSN
jgi:hypothetical protein